MSDINKTILIGRAVRDPELKYTTSGTAVAEFTLASSKTYMAHGEKKEEVSFIPCAVWGIQAETLSKYVKKGHRLGVTGRIKMDSWEDKDTGKKRSKLTLVVEEFQFLQGKSDGGQAEQPVDNKPFDDNYPPF